MSRKNPNFDPVFEQNPAAVKFNALSPADAVNSLNTLTTTFQRLLDRQYKEVQRLQMSSKKSDKALAATLSSMMPTRANMMHADQNPIGKLTKQLSTSRHQSVKNFLGESGQVGKDRRALMRAMTKMAVENSNMLIEKFNNRAANGASQKELRKIANQWMHNKNTFAPFVKDKYFNTVRMKYDEKLGNGRGIGKLSYIKFAPNKKDYELQFMHHMNSLRGSANDASDALEDFAESMKGVGNWLEPFSKAFGGTPIGDIASVFASAEKYGSQIMERLGYNNTEGITVSRMDSLGKLFESLGLGNQTGGEGGGAFSRGYKAMTGGLKALSPDDFARDAQGRNMGLKGRNTLFGKMGMGLGKLSSGKAFGGGKIGGAIGKAVGAAMKLPLGAMLGIAGGIASAAIGIFKFLAKHSPVLQAVEQMLNLFFTLFFMPIGNALGQVILPLMDGLFDWVLKWNDLWTDFSWDKFGGFLWDMISQIPIAIYELAKQLVNNFFDRIRDFWLGFKDVFIGILKAFGVDEGTIKNVEGFFDTVAGGIKAVRDWLESIFTGIQQYLSNPVEAVGNTLGDAWHNLTGLASGGIVQPTPSGTLALLAEGGEPEAVIPLSEMENVFGNTGGITVVINGDIYGMSDFESKVETVINRVSNRSAYR